MRSQEICFQGDAGTEGSGSPGHQVIATVVCRSGVSHPFGNVFLSFTSDLEGAADAAIERRNESEIGVILSRCSASDRLLIERLNRASTVKK